MGLALSGGGIRSATFNLGVLQALSELNVLAEFDYLSTVSGGGYIGSWLSAWVHRADKRNLEREGEEEKKTGRRPPHTPGILTVQERLSLTEHPDEPQEVAFLRSYSNYLTPKTGIFSTDTMAVVATYLRNLILNLSILLSCLTVVLLLPRMVAWVGVSLEASPHALFAFAVTGLAIAILFINLNLASSAPEQPQPTGQETPGHRGGCALVHEAVGGAPLDRDPPGSRGRVPELLAGLSPFHPGEPVPEGRPGERAPQCGHRGHHDRGHRVHLVRRLERGGREA